MNTYKDVAKLADFSKFAEETGAHSSYGECHNAITWLAVQIQKEGLSDYNVHLCTGSFAGRDHSWIQIENEKGKYHIVDMTVDQFGGDIEMPYAGPVCPGYQLSESVLLCMIDEVQDFVERLG